MKNTGYIKAATLIATVGLATGLNAGVIYNTTQAVWWETGPVNAYTGAVSPIIGPASQFGVPQIQYTLGPSGLQLEIWTVFTGTTSPSIPVADVALATAGNNVWNYGVNLASGNLQKDPTWLDPATTFTTPGYYIGEGYQTPAGGSTTYTQVVEITGGTTVGNVGVTRSTDGVYTTYSFTVPASILGTGPVDLFFGGGTCGNSPFYAAVPESGFTALLSGLGLLGYGVYRKTR